MSSHAPRKWVYIRGLGRHALHWAPFVEVFQKRFPEDEIEFLELRGNGTLSHSPSLLSVAANVRDLRSRCQLLKKYGSVYLMTLSLGSMIGVEWAHLYPDEIEGLVTVNTSDRGTSAFYQRMRPPNYFHLLRAFRGHLNNNDIEKKILQGPHLTLEKRQDLAQKLAEIPATSRSNFIRQLIAAGTYEFPDHKPKTEILLLASDNDELVHPDCTRRIAQMWSLNAHSHPGAGHDLPLEAPEWICDEISRWLAE